MREAIHNYFAYRRNQESRRLRLLFRDGRIALLIGLGFFYSGPWLDGIVQRYGMKPQIEFYEVFAVTDNARRKVELFREAAAAK